MSNAIDQLKRVFNDRCVPKSQSLLLEPKENMTRSLFLGDLDQKDILICRLDPDSMELFPYLKKSNLGGLKGMRSICDYIVFVEKKSTLFVLLIELKKGKDSPIKQLELSEPFIEFILARASIMKHLCVKHEIRKIGISDIPEKRTTSFRGNLVYDNNYLKLYKGNKVYLQKLLH